MFFSHGTTSCCIAIGYFGTKSFKAEDIKSDKNGRQFCIAEYLKCHHRKATGKYFN